MSEINSYKDLKVWQKAMELAEAIFRLTSQFPAEQKYVLVNQMQRSALSVPSNIAEGRTRHSSNDFVYFLNIARGSLAELETQLLLSQRLGFLEDDTLQKMMDMVTETRRMLYGLRESLKSLKPQTPNLKPVS